MPGKDLVPFFKGKRNRKKCPERLWDHILRKRRAEGARKMPGKTLGPFFKGKKGRKSE